MLKQRFIFCALVFFLFPLPATLSAAGPEEKQPRPSTSTGWTRFASAGSYYLFERDLDDGSSYDVSRFVIRLGKGYSWDQRTSASLTLGYNFAGYSFSNGNGMVSTDPWEDIHTFSLGLPLRVGIGEKWAGFFIPALRSSGETGSNFDETLTAGVLTGLAYRFNDRLTLGPGIGVMSQLEDSVAVFPVIIIDWKITDRLSLDTGRGLGASLGPGLVLSYQVTRLWTLSLGGRYEKLRFRLDQDGTAPNGVGEAKSFPVFASANYNFNRSAQVSLMGGIELDGELAMADHAGNQIAELSSDPGGFLGLMFRFRL